MTKHTTNKMIDIEDTEIDAEVLGNILYSINKRAKNRRNKKREYKCPSSDSKHGRYVKAIKEERYYYNMKEDILSRLKPVAIHKETKTKEHITKIFDYDDNYNTVEKDSIIVSDSYYSEELGREVSYIKTKEIEEENNYFLYYEVGDYKFHKPIEEEDISKYDLEIVKLKKFKTKGRKVTGLANYNLCNSIYKTIMSIAS